MPIFTRRFFILLSSGFVLALIAVFLDFFTVILLVFDGAVLILVLYDFYSVPPKEIFTLTREHSTFLSIGRDNLIRLQLVNSASRPVKFTIRDEYPQDFQTAHDTIKLNILPLHYQTASYYVKPLKKGSYQFDSVFVRAFGRLGLCARQYRYFHKTTGRVYPDLIELKNFIRLFREHREEELGYKRHLSGMETEFDYLREYRPGDQYRKINWKATARRRYPVTEVDQKEHNNHILVILDTGRMMTTRYGILTKLDYAIDTALILAAASRQKKDYFSLLTFSGKIETFLSASKKEDLLPRILQSLYATEASYTKSDYFMAYRFIKKRVTKNTHIFLFSELYNRIVSRELAGMINLLAASHHVHLISFEELESESKTRNLKEISRWIVQQSRYVEKETMIREFNKRGVKVLQVNPQNIRTRVVNSYLSGS